MARYHACLTWACSSSPTRHCLPARSKLNNMSSRSTLTASTRLASATADTNARLTSLGLCYTTASTTRSLRGSRTSPRHRRTRRCPGAPASPRTSPRRATRAYVPRLRGSTRSRRCSRLKSLATLSALTSSHPRYRTALGGKSMSWASRTASLRARSSISCTTSRKHPRRSTSTSTDASQKESSSPGFIRTTRPSLASTRSPCSMFLRRTKEPLRRHDKVRTVQPQPECAAERMWRTMFETARAQLVCANLPASF
jgi:hypothetical protein